MKMLKLENMYLNLDHVSKVEEIHSGSPKYSISILGKPYPNSFSGEDFRIISEWLEEECVIPSTKYEAVHDYDAPSMQEIKLAATEAAEYGHSLESVKAIPEEGDSVWLERGISEVSEVTRRTSTGSKDPEEVVILLYCTRPTPVKGISDQDLDQ